MNRRDVRGTSLIVILFYSLSTTLLIPPNREDKTLHLLRDKEEDVVENSLSTPTIYHTLGLQGKISLLSLL